MKFVKPKDGLIVSYPLNPAQKLPKEGAWITPDTNWKRLIRDGDVIVDEHKKEPTDNKQQSKKDVQKGDK